MLPEDRSVTFLALISEGLLDERELVRFVSTAASGGIAVFSGIVRNQHEGRAVNSIEYSAARPLADEKLAAICREVLEDEAIHRVGEARRRDPCEGVTSFDERG